MLKVVAKVNGWCYNGNMISRKFFTPLLMAAAISTTLALTSCGVFDPLLGGTDGEDSSTITINLDGEASMLLGDTTVLSVTIEPPPPEDINLDDNLIWTTTSTRVVSINILDGEVTLVALNPGETTIEVTHKPSGATSRVLITVYENVPEGQATQGVASPVASRCKHPRACCPLATQGVASPFASRQKSAEGILPSSNAGRCIPSR